MHIPEPAARYPWLRPINPTCIVNPPDMPLRPIRCSIFCTLHGRCIPVCLVW